MPEQVQADPRVVGLHWSNRANETLLQELHKEARAQCHDIIEQFADCARAQGMKVVFNCRKQNRAMNDCIHELTNEEKFAAYKAKREKELAATAD